MNKEMTEEAKALRRAYRREWYKKNRDKVRTYNERYWENAASREKSLRKRGQQGTASKEEAVTRAAEGNTQGRKGCKAARINMAFWTDNHNFITYAARAYGMSMTDFCNTVIEKYRDEHPDVQAKADKAQQNIGSLEL